jgi:hypothetical protein
VNTPDCTPGSVCVHARAVAISGVSRMKIPRSLSSGTGFANGPAISNFPSSERCLMFAMCPVMIV